MGVIASIRNSIGNRLVTADRSMEAQFEKAGLFMLRQEDFMVRHRHLQWLNDSIQSPFIEINDKVQIVDRAIGEVAATFAAMGSNPVLAYQAKCWKTAKIIWTYKYAAARKMHSYYTVRVNVDSPRLVLSPGDEVKTAKYDEIWESREDEIDSDTYFHYYSTMPDRVELLQVIPHGNIDQPNRRLQPWKGSQDKHNKETAGMELCDHGEYVIWSSFLKEHVTPRTSIVLHTGVPQGQQNKTIVPTSDLRRPGQTSAAGMQSQQ